jgi:hypothetical protein
MENKKTCLIGISKENTKTVIGPAVYSMIIINPDFFRQFPWIKHTDAISEINKSVEKTDKYLEQFEVYHIKPNEFLEENKEMEIKAIINLLNRRHRFWKDKIFIDTELDKEEFKELFFRNIPKNLQIANLQINKWTIGNIPHRNRLIALAKLYAKYSSINENNMTRGVWGDFGTGMPEDPKTKEFLEQNPECPHIKAKYRKVEK